MRAAQMLPALAEPIVDEPGTVSVHVHIPDLSACVSNCAAALPATGTDGFVMIALVIAGAFLVVGGIALARRFRVAPQPSRQ